ncbi:MAG: membrane dipeptidase [bacterium]|nr:membrane dipeptidase [bacterium]
MLNKRSIFISVFLLIFVLMISCSDPQPLTEEEILAKAGEIHELAITLDTHVDIAGAHYATPELDPGIDNPRLRCDLVKMENGGMDGVFLAVYVGQGPRTPEGYQRVYDNAMGKFEAIHRLTEQMYPDRCELALTTEDVVRIAGTGKRVIMIGIENGYCVGEDLSNVEKFYDLGTRYITLSHGGHNQICDSSTPRERLGDTESEHGGISEFGEQVVAEMNRLGIIADVSHISRESFFDLMRISKAPVMASHSGCGALNKHPRNLDDDQLLALKQNGGVIQIVALNSFLKATPPARDEELGVLFEEYPDFRRYTRRTPQDLSEEQQNEFDKFILRYRNIIETYSANITDYVNHIDHAVNLIGIDHVGIGTDFDGGAGIPGFNNHAEALNVTIELVRRGYSEEDIIKIWGGNLLRVWSEVEKAARELQNSN